MESVEELFSQMGAKGTEGAWEVGETVQGGLETNWGELGSAVDLQVGIEVLVELGRCAPAIHPVEGGNLSGVDLVWVVEGNFWGARRNFLGVQIEQVGWAGHY